MLDLFSLFLLSIKDTKCVFMNNFIGSTISNFLLKQKKAYLKKAKSSPFSQLYNYSDIQYFTFLEKLIERDIKQSVKVADMD